MQSGVFFFSFAVLFHYHQSELLHFPVSHFVGNYRGGRVAAVAAKCRREQPRCQVRWSALEKEWVQAGWVGHRRRAYGGHCQLSSGKRANIHSTAGTVTQIKEDCANTPRQAIIHCVSTSFLSLMSFAHSKSSLIIGAIFPDPFWATIVAFFCKFMSSTRQGTVKVHRSQIIFNLIPFGKWCFHNVVRSLHFVSFQWCKTWIWNPAYRNWDIKYITIFPSRKEACPTLKENYGSLQKQDRNHVLNIFFLGGVF